MAKEKEKRQCTDELIAKAQTGFTVRGLLSIKAWVLFMISVALELCINEGIFSCLFGRSHFKIGNGLFLCSAALGDIAKTIGVFSLFIVWIYAELGKYEFGWQYTDLLGTFCKHYHLRALSYFLAILACIYITTIGIFESAGIAMIIAALGLWDQAQVLVLFIFKSSVRKKLAVRKWEQLFQRVKQNENPICSLSEMYILADSISVNDDFFDKLCGCMAKGIIASLKKHDSEEIINISYLWERLLDGRPDYERSMILHNVLNHLKNLQKEEDHIKILLVVCAGYLQQQIRYYAKLSSSISDPEKNALVQILSDISQIQHKEGKNPVGGTDAQAGIIECMDSLYAVLIWMHFLCSNIDLVEEQVIFLSNFQHSYKKVDGARDVFESFIRCTFDDKTCRMYFDFAWDQVRHSSDEGNLVAP